ncbi:hypothetical protein BKA83DRAFT_4496455 [Pisolithus microcarpus]|nr:hypothetical protein BKA83DRAFT_4496455 [Pisolithus microcarpus]
MQSLQLLVGCGSGQCHLEGRALPLLTDVTTGNACITSVVDNNPVERVVIIDITCDILRQLHEVAPELTALKLVERQRPASLIRAMDFRADLCDVVVLWNDAFTWSIDLSHFTQLHRFLLRTPAALVNEADAESKEKELLTVWTTKSARGRKSGRIKGTSIVALVGRIDVTTESRLRIGAGTRLGEAPTPRALTYLAKRRRPRTVPPEQEAAADLTPGQTETAKALPYPSDHSSQIIDCFVPDDEFFTDMLSNQPIAGPSGTTHDELPFN